MTEEVVRYMAGGVIVRGKTPVELAAEEERRSIMRRLRSLEDRLDILEAQHRKLPPCDCPDCEAALAPYTGHTVIHDPLGEDGD